MNKQMHCFGYTGTYRPGDRVGIVGHGEFVVTHVLEDRFVLSPPGKWLRFKWWMRRVVRKAFT